MMSLVIKDQMTPIQKLFKPDIYNPLDFPRQEAAAQVIRTTALFLIVICGGTVYADVCFHNSPFPLS